MASQPIDILRPADNYRAFSRPVTLSGQRFVISFAAAEPARGSGWWHTLSAVGGVALIRSVRLVPSRDLWAHARQLVDGLPPGRLQLVAPADPQIEDLAMPGLVVLTYETDD